MGDIDKVQETLNFAAQTNWAASPSEFLQLTTQFLCKCLGVKYAVVATILDDDITARTFAVSINGAEAEGFDYSLIDAPCADAREYGYCEHSEQVQEKYPTHALMKALNVQSYLGLIIESNEGNSVSILSIMDDVPMPDTALGREVLKILSHRVSANIDTISNNRLTDIKIDELQSYKNALDQQSIVSVTDMTGKIISVNDAFCEISGYSRRELIGQTHRLVKSGYHTKDFYEEMWSTIANGNVWYGVLKNKAKDGSPYWVKSIIVPELNVHGKPVRYVSIRTDITQEYEKFEEVTKANSAKQRFLSSVSHEFRTPLNAAYGYVQLAQIDAQADAKMSNNLMEISKAIESLTDMVDAVVQYSDGLHLKRGSLEGVEFQTLFANVLEKYIDRVRKKELKIEVNCPPELMIYCYKDAVTYILAQYISNAIKFSFDGGIIKLSARSTSPKQFRVSVEDEGPGIAADYYDNLFEAFEKSNNSGSVYFGLGLGLNTVLQTANSINAEVGCTNNIEKGATFWLDLVCDGEQS